MLSHGPAHLEQLVLWRSEGSNLMCDVVGNKHHLPALWVLWSPQLETPGNHAHLGGCERGGYERGGYERGGCERGGMQKKR